MGKSISVQIGKEFFQKKGDLETRIRTLIDKYPLMGFLDEDDKEFCLNLFKHHPRCSEKIGPGVHSVQVRLHDKHATRCFHLHRIDGSDEDISWAKCWAAIK